MKDWIHRIGIFVIGSIILATLKALWGPRMAAFVWDLFVSLWVVLIPALAALIWWNIQFFRSYKRDKDAEFRSWLTAQENNWQKHFDQLSRRAEDQWEIAKSSVHSYCQNVESRLLRLERTTDQKHQDE